MRSYHLPGSPDVGSSVYRAAAPACLSAWRFIQSFVPTLATVVVFAIMLVLAMSGPDFNSRRADQDERGVIDLPGSITQRQSSPTVPLTYYIYDEESQRLEVEEVLGALAFAGVAANAAEKSVFIPVENVADAEYVAFFISDIAEGLENQGHRVRIVDLRD